VENIQRNYGVILNLKYLVTGTGRCGTVFLARFLTSVGTPCGHESIFGPEGLDLAKYRLSGLSTPCLSYCSKNILKGGKWEPLPDWITEIEKIQADSSYLAAPFLQESCLENCKKIHLVRDPIKVIHSFCNHIEYFKSDEPKDKFEKFIYEKAPELQTKMPQYDRACLFYVLWNNMIEKNNIDLFYKVEDPVDVLFNFLDLEKKEHFSDNTINTHKKWSKDNFDVHLIQSKEIKKEFIKMGRRYGYKMVSPFMV
jgi:hypothetical protein